MRSKLLLVALAAGLFSFGPFAPVASAQLPGAYGWYSQGYSPYYGGYSAGYASPYGYGSYQYGYRPHHGNVYYYGR